MSKYENGNWFDANSNGAFKVVLPGAVDYTVSATCDGCAYEGMWYFSAEANENVASVKIAWLEGEWSAGMELYELLDLYDIAVPLPSTGDWQLPLDVEEGGRYTYILLGYDAEGQLRCGDYSYFYVLYDNDDEWTSLGETGYGEDFIGSIYQLGPTEYKVELQENIDIPGYYRLVNAYQGEFALAESNYLEHDHNHYIYIDATDPDNVHIIDSSIGFDLGYGFMSVCSKAWYMEDKASEEDFGTLTEKDEYNKVITFPVKALLFAESEESKGAWFFANKSEGFYVEIPKASFAEIFNWTLELPTVPDTEDYYLLNAVSPIGTEVSYAIENMQELTKVNVLAEGDELPPIAEIIDVEEGKALKVNRVGIFDLVVTVAGNEEYQPYVYTQNYKIDYITGVVTVDATQAPARYFNLQGVEVAEPVNGLYIRVNGNSIEKVVK